MKKVKQVKVFEKVGSGLIVLFDRKCCGMLVYDVSWIPATSMPE